MESSHIEARMMPCITRTSVAPPHFDIFFGTQSVDDYGENDQDELNIEDWKVKPGRLNVFHTIIIFLVSCVWSQDASVQKAVRELWKQVFSINSANPERVKEGLIAKKLLATDDDDIKENMNSTRNSSMGVLSSRSGFVASAGGSDYSQSGYNRSW